MEKTVLVGKGRRLQRIPLEVWQSDFDSVPEETRGVLSFMTPEHHEVRNLAVTEIVKTGRPVPPEKFSQVLDLSPNKVTEILEDLEARLFFVVRNDAGCVAWAFPVTADPTPHRLSFTSGERFWGA